MKILHVVDHSIPLHSGYTFRSKAIFSTQRLRGWETEHITSSKHALAAEENPAEEIVDGLHFFRTGLSKGFLSKLPILDQWATISSLRKRLEEIIPAVKPDIIQAHSPALNGVAAILAGKKFALPVVYEVRGFWEDAAVSHGTSREGGLRYRLTRDMETWVLRRANGITCICEGIRSDLVKRGIAEEKITIIPNAVDHSRFNKIGERDEGLAEKLGLKNCKVLGFVGSFYKYEGLHLLLSALPKIMESMKNIKVLLVGGGQEAENLKKLAADLGIESHVVFTGRVPHDKVDKYYSLIDILVYPRISMRLTELVTPLKPLEAMAQHLLVLASDIGGHRELIQPGKTGILFQAGNAKDLAEKVIELFQQTEEWPRIKENARKFVETERNWKVSVSNYEPMYKQLLETSLR